MTIAFPPARFEHVRHAHGVTVHVHGEIDLCTRPELRNALDAAMVPRRPIVSVDLSGVTFMDASGMHELARARRIVVRRGARFVLVAPSPAVRVLVEIWRPTDPFEVRPPTDRLGRAM